MVRVIYQIHPPSLCLPLPTALEPACLPALPVPSLARQPLASHAGSYQLPPSSSFLCLPLSTPLSLFYLLPLPPPSPFSPPYAAASMQAVINTH